MLLNISVAEFHDIVFVPSRLLVSATASFVNITLWSAMILSARRSFDGEIAFSERELHVQQFVQSSIPWERNYYMQAFPFSEYFLHFRLPPESPKELISLVIPFFCVCVCIFHDQVV